MSRRTPVGAKRYDTLPAGLLQHRLIFEVKTTTDDSFGSGSVETWAEAFTVWGSYEPSGSKEFPTFLKLNEEANARFRIRYREDIDSATHRIKFAMDPGAASPHWKTFDIFPPVPADGQRFSLIIEATEIK